tara:strand:- start:52 stop:411 length:360 start_codon:yes stop_codon:yes gene_type:complete
MYKNRNKEYYIKNRDAILKQKKIYGKINSEIRNEKAKIYRQTPQGQMNERVTKWKKRGVLDSFNDNYKTLHKIYISTKFCENCNYELNINGRTRKCLDHCHQTGCFRNILCNSCNIIRK